jgi:hypothetical protein
LEVNERLIAEAGAQSSNPFVRFWRFITELFRGTPIENGVRKVLRDALGQCKQGETISQGQQLELLEAMAEIITEYTGEIVRDAGNLTPGTQKAFEILDVYSKELKTFLKSFLPKGCSNISVLKDDSRCTKTFELLDLIDLTHDVRKFKQIFPNISLTSADVALIKARGGRVSNLINKFGQKFPDWTMTSADFALFLHRPDLVEKIIKNGKISAEYHIHWQKSENARGAEEGFLLSCQDSGFKYAELSAKVNSDLFSEDETAKINARENLFTAVQQHSAIFRGDFIQRGQNLAVHLPNGVVVESSVEWRAANPREPAEEVHRDYLCYVLDKFHGAYGDEAPAAFLVFMQNLTGTENLATGLPFTFRRFERSWPSFLGNGTFFGALLCKARRSLMITMDNEFNMTGDLIYDMPARSNGSAVPDDNDIIAQASIYGAGLPEGYDPNGESNVIAIGARFCVPARCHESETDLAKRWEQPREDGAENQDTYLRFIASW